MSQIVFGSGLMFAQLEEGGVATPTSFGALQEVSLDFTASIKELFGSYQSPIAIARGTMKINGKAKMGKFQGSVISDLFFRSQTATGKVLVVNREPASIPDTAPYTISVAHGGASFTQDLGVISAVTGLPYQKVAASPAAGEYAVSDAGVYTFAVADADKAVGISYTYLDSTSGQIVTLSNQLLGQQPIWSLVISNEFQGKQLNIKMNRCVANKFTFANKLEDFNLPDFEFGCFADDANNIGTMWLSDKS